MITKFRARSWKHRLPAGRTKKLYGLEFKTGAALPAVLALSLTLSLFTGAYAQHTRDVDSSASQTVETASENSSAEKLLIAKKDNSDDDKKKKDKDKDKDKEKGKDSGDKDKKSDKDKKDDKGDDKKDDKKETKADNKDEKKDDKKEAKDDEGDKKKGGGLFHLGGKKKDKDEDEKAEGRDAKTEASKAQAANANKPPEDPNAPKYKFDPALISVLKDINKSLKDSEAVTKLEDPAQKLVAKLVGDTLEKALSAPELSANRIVNASDKAKMEKSGLSAESWESGNLDVSPDLKASVVAVWGKRIDGLVTVQIVGNYEGKVEGSQDKLGEFIAVITAHSTVDKGFDIQSQQDVNFWLGKVAEIKIDCTAGKPVDPNIKSYLKQYSPITQRQREYLLAMKEYKDKLARAEDDKKKQTDLTATQKVAEALAKTFSEAIAKSVGGTPTPQAGGADKPAPPEKVASADNNAGGSAAEKKSEGSSDLNANAQKGSEAPTQANQVKTPDASASPVQPNNGSATPTPTAKPDQGTGSSGSTVAALIPDSHANRSNWDSPAGPATTRQPSAAAAIVYPGRVVAGQYVTVAVVGPQNSAEQYVGLTFNGAQLSTGDNGKVFYQVPEDAQPGFSLHVGLSGRPEEPQGAIEVLQPLAAPREQQIPNLEGVSPVCSRNGIVTISGHSFDGIADRNRVIIDGAYDASVIVSSPVQLKVQIPPSLPAGPHTLCVSTAGLRSNPGNFDLVTVDLAAEGPDTAKNDLKKLMVKVMGTQNRVRVKLVNQSRDVIRLVKGDEVVVVTSGGAQNQALVPVQRLRSGNYKIETELLI